MQPFSQREIHAPSVHVRSLAFQIEIEVDGGMPTREAVGDDASPEGGDALDPVTEG